MSESRADRNRRDKARRYAARVEVDGRLVAVKAKRHGMASTYDNHGCRCEPCCAAARERNTPYRRELRRTDPDFRRRANEATRRYTARKRAESKETA